MPSYAIHHQRGMFVVHGNIEAWMADKNIVVKKLKDGTLATYSGRQRIYIEELGDRVVSAMARIIGGHWEEAAKAETPS
jgi:hypothetical protein